MLSLRRAYLERGRRGIQEKGPAMSAGKVTPEGANKSREKVKLRAENRNSRKDVSKEKKSGCTEYLG